MTNYVIIIIIVLILSGICWYLYYQHREKQLVDRLQHMVDQAVAGKLKREEITESKVSALENSLKRYLDDSLLAGENQMLQKNMIQGLISDIAHQTLTPISNLKIYSELLQEQISEDLNETADTIHEQTEKLDFLIQSLVKLSRMENGIITVHPEHISVSELLKSLDAQYRSKANEKQIQLEIREMDTLAKYDLKWTSEAVGNILDNAIKYTGEGGRVTVEVQSYSMFVRIDIKDTGMGISEEEIPKIFTRFYRSLNVSELPGVGIGLYLTREIIQAQKGYIKVESEVGKGTIFSVYLPQ
ncbi:MAG: HAMP domain-containing sensor histidine kinase [Lachnospiraceae bacterium]|nr:HAMP domain-containing sensor histidine kinase [Lachnospiraceae bacterium]MDD3617070.1 HAMP domain-containing sensor histidine kinase [Lachnospiraceae bacterium]